MVTGGTYDKRPTEIFSSGSWRSGPTLPGMIQHCQVTLGTTVIVAGNSRIISLCQYSEILLGNYIDGKRKTAHYLIEDATEWLPLPDMKYKRCNHACAAYNDAVYVMGTHCSGDSRKVEKYKLGWDSWVEIDDMPSDMTSGQAIVLDGKLNAITNEGKVYILNNEEKWEGPVASLGDVTYHKRSHPAVMINPTASGCGV